MKKTVKTAPKRAVMKKKFKKRIIALIVAVVLLITAVVATLIWYNNSVFPTAIKIADAVSDGDGKLVFEYIQPSDKRTIKLGMVLLGISEDDALKMALGNKNSDAAVQSFKILSYEQNGDEALLKILLGFSNGSMKEISLNFVREDGQWYLSVNELLSDFFK